MMFHFYDPDNPLGIPDSRGICGTNLKWELKGNGTLTISGTGDMEDYNDAEAPWFHAENSNNIMCDATYQYIKKVIIEDGVTSIGKEAFRRHWETSFIGRIHGCCCSLESVSIPDSVTRIGSGAFYECTGLKEIIVPDSVIELGDNVFAGCECLEKIYYRAGLVFETKLSCGNNAELIPTNSLVDESLLWRLEGNTITIIDKGKMYDYYLYRFGKAPWFKDRNSIEKVIVADDVPYIGDSAFSGCTSLKEVTIPASVTSIGDSAFSGCTSLKEVTIPASVTSIGYKIFSECSGLKNIYYRESSGFASELQEGNSARLVPVIIASGICGENVKWSFDGKILTVSGTGAMEDYSSERKAPWVSLNIEKVIIEDRVTSIGKEAFANCCNLNEIKIPASISTIGDGAFSGCKALGSVIIPVGVKIIGDNTFNDCTGLWGIRIAASVTRIGDNAFNGCHMTKIRIPANVETIGKRAFFNCCELEDIVLPNSLKTIDDDAFNGCNNLTDITIPDSLTYIGSRAFAACENLKKIIIPSSVKKIGEEAFANCSTLHKVILVDEVISIAKGAFRNCTSLRKVNLPLALEEVGEEIFSGCSNLKKVHHKKSAEFVDKLRVGNNANFYPIT